MIRYVGQPNGYGCAIACVAMIASTTYDEMEAWMLSQGLPRERMVQGIHEGIYLEALDRLGFVYARRWRCDSFHNRCDRPVWPPAPFAPIHMCSADVAAGHHAFVMLGNGTVFDPFKRERTTIAHPDYLEVSQVIGVWRRPLAGR